RSRLAQLLGESRDVPVGFSEEVLPAKLRGKRLLKEFGDREASCLDLPVQLLRKVHLHAGHTPIYTPRRVHAQAERLATVGPTYWRSAAIAVTRCDQCRQTSIAQAARATGSTTSWPRWLRATARSCRLQGGCALRDRTASCAIAPL